MLKLKYEILKFYFGDATEAGTEAVIKKYCLHYHIVFSPIKTSKDLPQLLKILPAQGIKAILPKILYKIRHEQRTND
jgi:hypothetical protein